MKKSLREKILSRIIVNEEGCWIWQKKVMKNGYARIKIKNKSTLVHRAAYTEWRGTIPDGLDLDHRCHPNDGSCKTATCFHRRCANPYHVEPATRSENVRKGNLQFTIRGYFSRRTHCKNGHEYTEGNTYRIPKNPKARVCRKCTNIRGKKYRLKKENN